MPKPRNLHTFASCTFFDQKRFASGMTVLCLLSPYLYDIKCTLYFQHRAQPFDLSTSWWIRAHLIFELSRCEHVAGRLLVSNLRLQWCEGTQLFFQRQFSFRHDDV